MQSKELNVSVTIKEKHNYVLPNHMKRKIPLTI